MNTDKIFAEAIANAYAPTNVSKVIALKKWIGRQKGREHFAYTLGVMMALVLGVGMSFSMKVIGDEPAAMMAVGTVVGVIGITGVSINYPIYRKLLQTGKQKYAFKILQLAQEAAE